MTLASNVAQLTDDLEDAVYHLRRAAWDCGASRVTSAPEEDRAAKRVSDLIKELRICAADVLDDEDHAPLTQEEVTRP